MPIRSLLCEVFGCSRQELDASGLFDEFEAFCRQFDIQPNNTGDINDMILIEHFWKWKNDATVKGN